MNDAPGRSAAWRLFTFNWLPLGAMALAFGLALAFAGFSMKL